MRQQHAAAACAGRRTGLCPGRGTGQAPGAYPETGGGAPIMWWARRGCGVSLSRRAKTRRRPTIRRPHPAPHPGNTRKESSRAELRGKLPAPPSNIPAAPAPAAARRPRPPRLRSTRRRDRPVASAASAYPLSTEQSTSKSDLRRPTPSARACTAASNRPGGCGGSRPRCWWMNVVEVTEQAGKRTSTRLETLRPTRRETRLRPPARARPSAWMRSAATRWWWRTSRFRSCPSKSPPADESRTLARADFALDLGLALPRGGGAVWGGLCPVLRPVKKKR